MTRNLELHADLKRDGYEVLMLRLSKLLLMNDANYPWLILVPQRPNKRDFHDLDPLDQYRVCDEITMCSEALQRLYSPYKVNVASLGNMTPQLHIHVVARFQDDPAWPGPIWGKVPPKFYEVEALDQRLEELRSELSHQLKIRQSHTA
ncbi:HIT domain-containing protein [Rhodovibrionaceae bacterium A322]